MKFNFRENINEGLKAIKDNMLRTALTVTLIAIGITALVGILTAIDGIQASVTSGLADLGANAFDIQDKTQRRNRRGFSDPPKDPLTYQEVSDYKSNFQLGMEVSISGVVSYNVEVKRFSKTTNPNSALVGIDENFLAAQSYNIAKGRNFSPTELQNGTYVVILGSEIAKTVFDQEDPINQEITVLDNKYRVVGVLEEKKGLGSGGGSARLVLIPIENALIVGAGRTLTFSATTIVKDPTQFDYALSEATGLMRRIRRDQLGQPESFEISRSESLAAALDSIAGALRIGGFGIGFITLLGASIGLINIMMVSVTERTREIGIRKALGATPARIREQFLIEAIVICQIGGACGILIGILIGNLVAIGIGGGGFVVPWLWMIVAVIICIVVGVLSGFYPAYKASKLDPIESLRFE